MDVGVGQQGRGFANMSIMYPPLYQGSVLPLGLFGIQVEALGQAVLGNGNIAE